MRLTRWETRCAQTIGTAWMIALTSCGDSSSPPMADLSGGSVSCAEIMNDGRDREAVELSIQWTGPWDDVAGPALLEQYSTYDPSVAVEILPAVLPEESVSALSSEPSPVLARVPIDAVSALFAAGQIRPFDACLDQVATTQITPAQTVGMIGDGRYAVAGNLDIKVMLFDRDVFSRAGLDPSDPPSTLAELQAAARTIRDELGIERPIASLSPVASLWDQNELGDDLPVGATTWLEMQIEGLLLAPNGASGFPPLGDGAAAVQIVNQSELWSYASALAAGQSPLADLGAAPIPGSDSAFVPIGREVWVLSAHADAGEVMAANAVMEWLLDSEQQSAFHQLTDLFPASTDAVSNARNAEYWRDLPLLEDTWKLLLDYAMSAPEWLEVPGAAEAIQAHLTESSTVSDAATGWVPLVDLVDDTAAAMDPDELLACLYGSTGPPKATTACSKVDGG